MCAKRAGSYNREDDFDNAFEQLMKNEGLYSNDPVDTGGATIYGISSKSYPDAFKDVYEAYKSGRLDIARNKAKSFYRKEFWHWRYNQIPDSSLAFKIFDLSVNKGTKKAITLLQLTLKEDMDFPKLTVDGFFGPQTLAAIQCCKEEDLYNAYIKRNETDYAGLKTAFKFLKGWLNRLKKRIDV